MQYFFYVQHCLLQTSCTSDQCQFLWVAWHRALQFISCESNVSRVGCFGLCHQATLSSQADAAEINACINNPVSQWYQGLRLCNQATLGSKADAAENDACIVILFFLWR